MASVSARKRTTVLAHSAAALTSEPTTLRLLAERVDFYFTQAKKSGTSVRMCNPMSCILATLSAPGICRSCRDLWHEFTNPAHARRVRRAENCFDIVRRFLSVLSEPEPRFDI